MVENALSGGPPGMVAKGLESVKSTVSPVVEPVMDAVQDRVSFSLEAKAGGAKGTGVVGGVGVDRDGIHGSAQYVSVGDGSFAGAGGVMSIKIFDFSNGNKSPASMVFGADFGAGLLSGGVGFKYDPAGRLDVQLSAGIGGGRLIYYAPALEVEK